MLACMDPSKNKGHQFVTTALGKVVSLLHLQVIHYTTSRAHV